MLLLITAPRPGLAQDDLQAFVKHYDELFEAGNYAGALAEARKFESAARARYGTQDMVLQARALYVLGKYLEAERLYKPALAIFEMRDLANTLNGLGRVYEHEGRYARLDRATPPARRHSSKPTFSKRTTSLQESTTQ